MQDSDFNNLEQSINRYKIQFFNSKFPNKLFLTHYEKAVSTYESLSNRIDAMIQIDGALSDRSEYLIKLLGKSPQELYKNKK